MTELRTALTDAIARLDEINREATTQLEGIREAAFLGQLEQSRALQGALRAALEALSESVASIGECRLATPYSTLRPVIDAQGELKWCCNHDPEHCR